MSTLPTKIGKYDVVALIGRAGLGLVYDAVDPDVGRPVVIKAITGPVPLDADDVNCFWSEAQPAAGLQHPNIVNIYDAGVHEGNPYMVTEYLDGESLEAALKGSRALSLFDKINIAICVCRGLAYAHQCGIAHYGIQPASIVLCNDGMIRIADFAIAHAASQALIRTGDAVGPLSYMAPEQLELRTTDYRADIFSMGVVLYQLISNHHPFEGDSPVSTIFKIMHEPTPSLNTFRNDYAPEIEAVLLRAMAKNPAERYSSADDFAFALERLMEHFKDGSARQERQDISSPEQDEVGSPVCSGYGSRRRRRWPRSISKKRGSMPSKH